MPTAFDQLAQALALVLGTDQPTAGFIMGLIVIVIALVAVSLALRDPSGDPSYLIFTGVLGAAFDVLAGWWPLWTVLLLFLVVAFLLTSPFREGGRGRGP